MGATIMAISSQVSALFSLLGIGTTGPVTEYVGTAGVDLPPIGGAGSNYMTGLANADILNGGGGNDYIEGGAGADLLVGGAGNDTLGYATAGSGVNVTLVAGTTALVGGAAAATLRHSSTMSSARTSPTPSMAMASSMYLPDWTEMTFYTGMAAMTRSSAALATINSLAIKAMTS
jgi:hypothetical protein